MRVLVGCEMSGAVRNALRRVGVDAWSCDHEASLTPGPHIIGDVLQVIRWGWDGAIVFPPCTFINSAGMHWNGRDPSRAEKTRGGVDFARRLWESGVPIMAMENPVGILSTHIRKPDQIIQPYQYGHDASKKTCLWLRGLPRLVPTLWIAPRLVDGRPRWHNQTDSGQNAMSRGPKRAMLRSLTYSGVAWAMAWQWGGILRGPGDVGPAQSEAAAGPERTGHVIAF